MHIDLDIGGPARFDADVAIIGAGVAGITIARQLLARGLSILLIESGGLDYEEATARLNAGDNAGQPYYDLEDSRLRFFGGTTAIWGGRCAELSAIDFRARSWVPHSGWPFGIGTLRPYYCKAWQSLGLPPQAPGAEVLKGLLPYFSPKKLVTHFWLFDNQVDRFCFSRCRDLAEHPRCTIVTHATVREIVPVASGRAIGHLDVRSLGGRRLDIRARDFVLATGGIENARLLLASRSVQSNGLGNDHDQVGRYFMEHPHARGGRIVGKAGWQWLSAFRRRRIGKLDAGALITPSPELQAREGLLNTSLTIGARRPADGDEALLMRVYQHARHRIAPTRQGRSLWQTTKRSVGRLQKITDPLRPWLLNKAGCVDVALVIRGEQAPNPDSRVRLNGERDALGMQRVTLDWRTSSLDVESAAGLVGALAHETQRLGLGQVEAADWLSDPSRHWVTDPRISTHPIGGYHHMGTTRMSDDPRTGVTDAEGRVHGIDNLYVAGSSLFPTSGWANPTLTIIALSMRTADTILKHRALAESVEETVPQYSVA